LLVVDWDDGTACCVVWVSDDDGNVSAVVTADVGLGVDTIVVVTCPTRSVIFRINNRNIEFKTGIYYNSVNNITFLNNIFHRKSINTKSRIIRFLFSMLSLGKAN
jgi:hypothetical protein